MECRDGENERLVEEVVEEREDLTRLIDAFKRWVEGGERWGEGGRGGEMGRGWKGRRDGERVEGEERWGEGGRGEEMGRGWKGRRDGERVKRGRGGMRYKKGGRNGK